MTYPNLELLIYWRNSRLELILVQMRDHRNARLHFLLLFAACALLAINLSVFRRKRDRHLAQSLLEKIVGLRESQQFPPRIQQLPPRIQQLPSGFQRDCEAGDQR